MSGRRWNTSLALASSIAVAVAAASLWIEWSSSYKFGSSLSPLGLSLVMAVAGLAYSLRIIRFHKLLKSGGVPISLGNTALAQGVGFALSVTPGSVGEVFKLHLIRERSGAPLLKSAPVLLLDHIMEGTGFLVLALASTSVLPSLAPRLPGVPLLAAAMSLVLLLALGRQRPTIAARIGRAVLEKMPFGQRLLAQLQAAWQGVKSSLVPGQILTGLTLTALARVADGLVLLLAAQMLGVTLALPYAIFIIALSGFAGGLSLLPGGAGATETTMAGLLILSGAPLASALAITLLARLSTLWLWVGLGLGEAFILQLAPARNRMARPQVNFRHPLPVEAV